jgi:hypothetical protein
MKRIIGYTIITLTLVLVGMLVSADVTLIEFQPNTPIKSAEVNANFAALKSDLATKQVSITEGCTVGSAIRTINDDGTVECEAVTAGGGDFYTKAEIDAKLAALTGDNINNGSLKLADLGGGGGPFTQTVSNAITLAAGACQAQLTGNFGAGVIGNMVVGTLSDPSGNPVLPNTAAVMPSIVIGTTQGGAVPNLIVCNTGGSTLTIPVGSVFTWRMIAP